MAKIAFIITALMTLLLCVEAFPNANNEAVIPNPEDNIKPEQAEPSLDSEHRIAEAPEANDDNSSQGQRRKRFYNYFSFGYSPYDSFNSNFVKTDQPQLTGENGVQEPLSQILKRVQEILTYTKQQALNPPSSYVPQAPLYVPVLYIPQAGCGCTYDSNETPSFDSDATTTPTSTPTPNTTQPPYPINDTVPVTPSPTNDDNKTPMDFSTRFSENMGNNNDGARPISFEPIKPDRPLSRPPPPVQHGSSIDENSVQNVDAAFSITTPSPAVGVPAQPHLPTNSIPTLCDTAVLTCCHQPKVTVSCFVKQGCPDLSQYDEPCGANVILRAINKFEFYYNNRRG